MHSYASRQVGNVTRAIRNEAVPITGSPSDYDILIDAIGNRPIVLIGEATHGTQEFYQHRAEITKRLIAEKGFSLVAIEGDWPDALRIHRYVRGETNESADRALSGFQRFPTWMWRNTVVLDFVEWLRRHNSTKSIQQKTGFYGLDLYSLYSSIQETIRYLDRVDAEAAQRARIRYGCLDLFEQDSQAYGYAASFGLSNSCETEVVHQLADIRQHALDYESRDGRGALDEFFYAEQNARVVRNAERYYRSMFGSRVSSWNLRDQHMAETLSSLESYYNRVGQQFKAVIWAHNSHLGDARATYMGEIGELNLGQLVREQYPGKTFSIGFSTYTGTVTAASNWDAPAERKRVRPGLPGSYESFFHELSQKLENQDFCLVFTKASLAAESLKGTRLERAIGVLYLPETERQSHYFEAKLSDQFDAILYLDQTNALVPLDSNGVWVSGEEPETFPTGL